MSKRTKYTTKPVNTRVNRIEQKRYIARKIFDRLVGVEGLGEIKTHEFLEAFAISYVECFIPITDYNCYRRD